MAGTKPLELKAVTRARNPCIFLLPSFLVPFPFLGFNLNQIKRNVHKFGRSRNLTPKSCVCGSVFVFSPSFFGQRPTFSSEGLEALEVEI